MISTANMIQDRVHAFAWGLHYLATRDFKNLGRLLYTDKRELSQYVRKSGKLPTTRKFRVKDSASLFLEWKFGWAPFIADMAGLIKRLSSMTEDLTNTPHRVKAAVVQQQGLGSFLRYRREGAWEIGVETGVTYLVNDPSRQLLRELGLQNPLLTGWNLSTLSFVVDWFINISAFLTGWSAPRGLTFMGGYETHFTRASGVLYDDQMIPECSIGEVPSWDFKASGMSRYVLYDFPNPRVSTRLTWDPNKALVLLALLVQRS
jgi:hypothetical protein